LKIESKKEGKIGKVNNGGGKMKPEKGKFKTKRLGILVHDYHYMKKK